MTQVKICGITNTKDAMVAVDCGAAALGFIFYSPSPRYVPPEEAGIIIGTLPDNVIKIGVFVNENMDVIKRAVDQCRLDMIQLHGDETPEFCRNFPASMTIKAVELKNEDDLSRALNYDVAGILVDSRQDGLYGGTGKVSNWELAARLKYKRPLILSGGLHADNIAEAIQKIAPAALDINSGVEESPGKKNHKKLVNIFDIIRDADTAPENSQLIFKKKRKI